MKRYELKGTWYTIDDLSEMSGIPSHTLRDRLRRGYSVEEAVKVTPTHDSVKAFCDASLYTDWIGIPMETLHHNYWKWCLQNGFSPITKQGLSRQIMNLYPMLKTIPTKRGERCYRIIRLRGAN
jgi:hypothetical protein